MVRIVLPAASLTGVMQDRVASPSMMHRAGAAEPRAAAEFRPDQAEFVAQRPQQRHLRLDVDRDFPPVDDKIDHGPQASDRACCSATSDAIGAREVRRIVAGARSNRRERRTHVA